MLREFSNPMRSEMHAFTLFNFEASYACVANSVNLDTVVNSIVIYDLSETLTTNILPVNSTSS